MRVGRSTTRSTGRPDAPPAGSRGFPPSVGHSPSRADSPGGPVLLRLRVFVTRRRLDRQIAAGHTCDAPALDLRARQLTDLRSQQAAANSLRRVVGHVDRLGAGPDLSAAVIDRAAVRASREAILGLADRLNRAGEVSPQGMVLARELITEGATSPLYGTKGGRILTKALWEISDALGTEQPIPRSDATSCHE
jgi:hypothetical protein